MSSFHHGLELGVGILPGLEEEFVPGARLRVLAELFVDLRELVMRERILPLRTEVSRGIGGAAEVEQDLPRPPGVGDGGVGGVGTQARPRSLEEPERLARPPALPRRVTLESLVDRIELPEGEQKPWGTCARVSVVLVAIWAAGCGDQQPGDIVSPGAAVAAATEGALLAEIRAATARYHRVEEALAAGYVAASACVPNRGIHYVKPALVDTEVDPSQPEALLYQVLPSGQLQLSGVEFLIPAAAWDFSNSSPPILGEQAFVDRRSPPFGASFPN